jgi:hypothetical protein
MNLKTWLLRKVTFIAGAGRNYRSEFVPLRISSAANLFRSELVPLRISSALKKDLHAAMLRGRFSSNESRPWAANARNILVVTALSTRFNRAKGQRFVIRVVVKRNKETLCELCFNN